MKAAEIARLLPDLYQDAVLPGSVLAALLAVMESLQAPDEAAIAGIDGYFRPRRAPDAFVEMLAGWLALDAYLERDPTGQRRGTIQPGPLRDLVAYAAEGARMRGTEEALIGFLTRATGVEGFSIENNPPDAKGRPQDFHIRVHVPEAALGQIDFVRRIVAAERPAFVTFELSPTGVSA